MALNNRQSIRLKEYDYSKPRAYFVTVCTKNRNCLFGEIVAGADPCVHPKMELNDIGKIINKWWKKLPDKFPTIEIDEFVVMPNHFHGIINIIELVANDDTGTHMGECPKST